ncbi:hypothetical protein L873DRAFT_1469727 [Choiromyces venosus 120613-1]|uniref:Uncharacterized protein n=1 Tax=Choiromyces venosus 120613-1 TaxID=1336337 RepID=A0A3N4JA72_9PEZI|nr:hypothetical protein L873DRAFT_1469727 [Choiromyces venosus 120613-1]
MCIAHGSFEGFWWLANITITFLLRRFSISIATTLRTVMTILPLVAITSFLRLSLRSSGDYSDDRNDISFLRPQ